MQSKLRYLTFSSLKKKLKSKWFIVINIILLIVIPCLCNIDSIIKAFGGDFDKPTNLQIFDKTGYVYDNFKQEFLKNNKFVLEQSDINIKEAKEDIKQLEKDIEEDKGKDIIIEIIPNNQTLFEAKVISYDTIDTFLYQNIINSLNNTKSAIALSKSNINQQELADIYKTINIEREYISDDVDENGEFLDLLGGVIIPVVILPIFFLIILVVQMIGAEINDEKTSRSMEVIISSVSPKIHFAAKMISTNVFVIIQGLLFLLFGAIGLVSRSIITKTNFVDSLGAETGSMVQTFMDSNVFGDIIFALPFTLILLLLSFVAFTLIAGILASVTTSIEDFSQIQTPLMIILVLGYYIAIIASVYESSLFIKIAAFVPLISTIVAPVLLILGQIGIVEILISIVLMIVLVYILVKYGLRIYKVGILNYSSNKLWKKMFKAAKQK